MPCLEFRGLFVFFVFMVSLTIELPSWLPQGAPAGWLVASLCCLLLAAVMRLRWRLTGSHGWRWRSAKRVWKRMRDGGFSGKAFLSYLRKVDPFVFEELVLYSFRKAGYRIIRNARYTGDGGVDGRVIRDGKRYLLQMKRYSGFIHLEDVQALDALCRKKNRGGLFVHTGRVPDSVREYLAGGSRVVLVDGARLYDLVVRGVDPLSNI